jgi:hypothetical protein
MWYYLGLIFKELNNGNDNHRTDGCNEIEKEKRKAEYYSWWIKDFEGWHETAQSQG